MKRLLIIGQSLGGGGTEIAMVDLINSLDARNYDITLLLIYKNNDFFNQIKRKINIKYLNYSNKFWYRLVSMNNLNGKIVKKVNANYLFGIYNNALKHVQSPVFDKKYDLAIDFYGYGSFTTALLAQKINAKNKISFIHDEKMPWIKNVQRYFNNIDEFFCVSNAIQKKFERNYEKQKSKTEVFYNVRDLKRVIQKSDLFYPKEFKNNASFKITTVGRLTEQKGYDIAIKTAKILKNRGLDFKWYFLGDGRDKNKLRRMIKKFNLEENVYLLGYRDNPYPYIKNSDLYIQPSRHEGYGLALLEARALKKIVIASDLPAFREQINNKKNGLISKLNPNDLSKCIIKVLKDNELKEEINKDLKKEKLNFNTQIKKIEDLIS